MSKGVANEKFRFIVFTYSIKGEIREFGVVDLQRRSKCIKKRDASAKLLFC